MQSPIFFIQSPGLNSPQLIKLVVFLIIFGFSFISWVFRKLQEQAAKKRARDAAEQRKLEILRTGRDAGGAVSTTDSDSIARQEAARRRAQIEELRRRQQERARQQTAARPASHTALPSERPVSRPLPPIVKIPGSSGPTVPQPRTPAVRTIPIPKPARPAPERKRPVVKQPRRQDVKTEPRRIAAPLADQQTHAQAMNPGQPRPSPAAPGATGDRPKSPADWRRAIIMNEILSPPLSVREDTGRAAPLLPIPGGPSGGLR